MKVLAVVGTRPEAIKMAPVITAAHRRGLDVVVCATSAPDLVMPFATARAAMHKRPARPLFFIDQALPRDVDPAVAEIDNVFLYNLDDLAKIAEENRAAREAEIAKCRAIAAEKADALWRQVAPQVEALSKQVGTQTLHREKTA